MLHLHESCNKKSAARCAEVALATGRSSIDVSKVRRRKKKKKEKIFCQFFGFFNFFTFFFVKQVMSLVSLSNLLCGEGLKSLRSSQKAVHMFPDVTENWVVLLASVLSKSLQRESTKEIGWLKKMITYIRRKFASSKQMTQWLSNNNRKIDAMADKLVS